MSRVRGTLEIGPLISLVGHHHRGCQPVPRTAPHLLGPTAVDRQPIDALLVAAALMRPSWLGALLPREGCCRTRGTYRAGRQPTRHVPAGGPARSRPVSHGRVRASRENREIGTYLAVAKQERVLVEPFAPQPGGDFVVALAGVARATRRHHVPERVTTAPRDGQNTVALKRPLRGAAVRAPSPGMLQGSPLGVGQVVNDLRHAALASPRSPSPAAPTHGHVPNLGR